MFDKLTILKVLLLISFLATVYIVWVFVSYTYQGKVNNNSEIVYIQSSSQFTSSSNQRSSSSIIPSQSSSITVSSSSDSSSSSSLSSSISSLPFPVLENNINIVKDIELVIQKPDPEIQAIIKEAKNRSKKETKVIVEEGSLSISEVSTKTNEQSKN